MKSYLSLVPLEAKVHRKQNFLTIFCIALAVFLVTGVFSMADMAVRMENQILRDKHGYWHIFVHDVSEDSLLAMKEEAFVKVISTYDILNSKLEKDYQIGNHKVSIAAGESNFTSILNLDFIEGSFPKTIQEVALTKNAKEQMGYQVGDTVIIDTPSCQKEFVISGFMEDASDLILNDSFGVFCTLDAFEEICMENEEEHIPVHYICFRDTIGLKSHIAAFEEKYALTKENSGKNTAILGIRGISDNSYILGLYGSAAFLVLLVLLAGVFMIAGSMNSNISERTQFFGMLRCIGASKQQIMHIVRREALNWCKVAIPAGEGMAIVCVWRICNYLRYKVGGEFSGIPVWEVSYIGMLSGIIMGIVSVLIAAHAPARKAAKVSPVAAVSGNSEEEKKIRSAAKTKWCSIEIALGIHHATFSKRNIILMTSSFALSIILFLSFSTMLDWINHALNTLKPYTPDITIADEAYNNTISMEVVKEIEQIEGVKSVFGSRYEDVEVETDKDVNKIDFISYEEKQFAWAKTDVLAGDISKINEEKGYVMTVFEKGSPFEIGDKIVINGIEVEVAAILSDSPFTGDGVPIVISSEETFYEITGENSYSIVDIQLTKNASDETVDRIRSMMRETDIFRDYRATNRETNSTYFAFSFLVYGFLGLIALITIFHIMNSISMSVSARIKQCGMMRAVGMGQKQMVKMIAAEALSYGICGCFVGCAVGLPIARYFYVSFITNHWGTPWKVPVVALLIIVGLTICSAAVAVHRPAKRIKEMTITDTIHSL